MMKSINIEQIQENQSHKLRRDVLALAVLSQLREKKYGYALMDSLDGLGLKIEQGILYPLLRCLEENRLLLSEWDVEGSCPRLYSKTARLGVMVYDRFLWDWDSLVPMMGEVFREIK